VQLFLKGAAPPATEALEVTINQAFHKRLLKKLDQTITLNIN